MNETIAILIVDDELITLFASVRLLRSAVYIFMKNSNGWSGRTGRVSHQFKQQ